MPTRTDPTPFTFRDGERLVHFGRGRARDAVELVGGPGYVLLTTERAAAGLPAVAGAAAAVRHVPDGFVDEIATGLAGTIRGERVVALGGGRVIDVAKSVVAAGGGSVAAIPTTLSGAEMTSTFRPAKGATGPSRMRPSIVVSDPALMASLRDPALSASALNALAHAIEAPCTVHANPMSTLAAAEAVRLLVKGLGPAEPDRDSLALGALLAGYALDSSGLGLHHVLAQTVVRAGGAGHGPANAVMLPHTLGALAWRVPHRHELLTALLGEDPVDVVIRLCARTGATTLRDLGVEREALAACADEAAERPQLDATPPRASRAEVMALYERAW